MVFWLGFAPLAFGSVKNLHHKAVVYNSAWRGVKLPKVLQYLRYCNACILLTATTRKNPIANYMSYHYTICFSVVVKDDHSISIDSISVGIEMAGQASMNLKVLVTVGTAKSRCLCRGRRGARPGLMSNLPLGKIRFSAC